MPEPTPPRDLLFAMRDLGIPVPLPSQIDACTRLALDREIERAERARPSRSGSQRRGARRLVLIPVALLATAAVAAATTVIPGIINPVKVARQNVRDTPRQLFENNPDVSGATRAPQTVIPSTVRNLGTFGLAGVGPLQYWVADTQQHGVCGGLRMSNGQWVGLQHEGKVGGNMPGCYPTRAQVGAGALIIDGLDYIESSVTDRAGQRWYIVYGAVSGRQTPTRVRDTFSKTSASLISGHYFAIALHPVGHDYGDNVHLEAFDARGGLIAAQGKPLAGTPTVKCVGKEHVWFERIPGTHRFARMGGCTHLIHVLAK